MNASKIVVVDVIFYIVLFVIMYFTFSNTKFSGGDAAGNALSSGYTWLLGLGVSFVIGIILTIINIWLFKNISSVWIKLFSFVPILLPVIIFSVDYFGIGRPDQNDEFVSSLQLTLEIRSPEKIDSTTLTYKSSKGGYSRKLNFYKGEDNFYYDEFTFSLGDEEDRRFIIKAPNIEIQKNYFRFESFWGNLDYNEWTPLNPSESNIPDSMRIEFRYKFDFKAESSQ